MQIGDWIQRQKRGVPHLVESLVANDVITRCGRRMRDEPNRDGGLVKADRLLTSLFGACKSCDR